MTAIAKRLSVQIRVLGSILGVMLALSPHPAGAARAAIVTPTRGDIVSTGQLVEVRWVGLPDDVDEMELLLDLDERVPLHLRLTPQLTANSGSYLWRVPNLPGNHVRLRLRCGRDGVEFDGPSSSEFTILANVSAPAASCSFREGEWWVDRANAATGWMFDGHDPVVTAAADGRLSGTLAPASEFAPGLTRIRRERVPALGNGLAGTLGAGPEIGASCPQSFPLRP